MYLSRDINVYIYLVKAAVATGRRGGSGHRVIYSSEYTGGDLIGGLKRLARSRVVGGRVRAA